VRLFTDSEGSLQFLPPGVVWKDFTGQEVTLDPELYSTAGKAMTEIRMELSGDSEDL
jgi:hypothetical protein